MNKLIAITLALSLSLQAQNLIKVKYRSTPVDIDKQMFKCLKSDSSLVNEACHDRSNQYMVINLQGTWYHYCSIPVAEWKAFNSALSLGRYYRKHIRGNFDCRVGYVPRY